MTSKDHLKLELMVHAINKDFFGYGSSCKRKSNGQWVSEVDCEKYIYSGKQLADEFDTLDKEEQTRIIESYFNL